MIYSLSMIYNLIIRQVWCTVSILGGLILSTWSLEGKCLISLVPKTAWRLDRCHTIRGTKLVRHALLVVCAKLISNFSLRLTNAKLFRLFALKLSWSDIKLIMHWPLRTGPFLSYLDLGVEEIHSRKKRNGLALNGSVFHDFWLLHSGCLPFVCLSMKFRLFWLSEAKSHCVSS